MSLLDVGIKANSFIVSVVLNEISLQVLAVTFFLHYISFCNVHVIISSKETEKVHAKVHVHVYKHQSP